jgi:hypothetical protein
MVEVEELPSRTTSLQEGEDEDITMSTTTLAAAPHCHTRVLGVQSPGANIITRCAGTKSHTYDESWHRIECHIFTT